MQWYNFLSFVQFTCLIVMTEINISCNVNGLNGLYKRTSFFTTTVTKKVDIALINLWKDYVHRCNNKYYKVVSFAATDNKTKGAFKVQFFFICHIIN